LKMIARTRNVTVAPVAQIAASKTARGVPWSWPHKHPSEHCGRTQNWPASSAARPNQQVAQQAAAHGVGHADEHCLANAIRVQRLSVPTTANA
jgi:hypothetical protein